LLRESCGKEVEVDEVSGVVGGKWMEMAMIAQAVREDELSCWR